jgi:hypothetical protein
MPALVNSFASIKKKLKTIFLRKRQIFAEMKLVKIAQNREHNIDPLDSSVWGKVVWGIVFWGKVFWGKDAVPIF